jgi:NAD(P)-dependent dehydrogenase (short-subunit alcohol dehydrogenase family)
MGGLAFPPPIEITLSDSVHADVAEVLSRTGRIDILVNNAGIAGRTAPVWEVTDEDWRQIVAQLRDHALPDQNAVASAGVRFNLPQKRGQPPARVT